MEDVACGSCGLPNLGFSLKRVNDAIYFPCKEVCELVGLSKSRSILRCGYSSMEKSFKAVGIETPFFKFPECKRRFMSTDAFLCVVFGGVSAFNRSEGFDIERLLNLRKFLQRRIFAGGANDGTGSSLTTGSPCPVTCGGGPQKRFRTCTNPLPAKGGKYYVGSSKETLSCNLNQCPVHGMWSSWTSCSSCPVTCGGGQETRYRTCINPRRSNGGNDCFGSSLETSGCANNGSQVDVMWSSWSPYSQCPVACEGEQAARSRTCTNLHPSNGDQDCVGSSMETGSCNLNQCPVKVEGGWSSSGPWSSYSVSCGGGNRKRSRTCTNLAPTNGAKLRPGSSVQTGKCNHSPCPTASPYSPWRPWWPRSVTCDGGLQFRNRTCHTPPCTLATTTEARVCDDVPCPACVDLYSWCKRYAGYGYCNGVFKDLMDAWCKKSCKRCKGK